MLLNNENFLAKINKYNGYIAIWGLSVATKKFLKKYPKTLNRIYCIIDNDISLQGQYYLEKPIVSFEEVSRKNNLLVALLGNHTQNIEYQLKEAHFNNYVINYDYANNFLKKDLVIEIDYVSLKTQKEFCDYIIRFCTDNLLECHIKPYKYIDWPMNRTKEDVFENIVKIDITPSQNTLVFSAHTVGEINPQIFRWKIGYLHNTITFDEKGYSGWSSLLDNTEIIFESNVSKTVINKCFTKLENKYIKKNLSKYEQFILDFDFPKEFIFFPLQLFNDTVMLQSNFEPLKLFKDIVKILTKKNIKLVVKRHPFCNNKSLEELLIKYENENKIIIFNGSIHDAISKCTTVYVINSGVGFEALLHLKPVITFGRSDYMSVTRHIESLEEIDENPFYKLDDSKKDRIKQFLYYFYNQKCININNKKDIKKKITNFIINYINKGYYENR